MRRFLVLPLALAVSACVYHIPIRQGNILAKKKVQQLKVGMTDSQVQYLLGTPLANDPFTPDRWTYLYYYKSPGNKLSERVLHLYFKQQHLARIEGPVQLEGQRQTVRDVENQPKTGPTPSAQTSAGESTRPTRAGSPSPTTPTTPGRTVPPPGT